MTMPPIATLTPYQFLTSSAVTALWFPLICIGCLFVFRAYHNIVCPRGFDVLRSLELDDLPDQRFDGIENALFDRLRDPWNYQAMPTLRFAARHEEQSDEEERREKETAAAVREAANLLRTVKNTNKKTAVGESFERPASATATALASTTAVRRGSGASFAAGAAITSGSGAAGNKWDVWNAIADGKSDGVVAANRGGSPAAAINSARSDESSNLSTTSAHSFFGKPLVDLRPTGAQFGDRQSAPLPQSARGGHVPPQWSSRVPGGARPSLALDLSRIKVAPPNIAAPPPRPVESLKFYTADEHAEAYSILPLNPGQAQALPPRLPIRLGPPGGVPRGFAPSSGFSNIPRGPLGMTGGPGGRAPPPRLLPRPEALQD